MSYFCSNLNTDNFSFTFGENVRFTSYRYNETSNIITDSAPYWMAYSDNYNMSMTIPRTLKNGYDFFGYSLLNFNAPVHIDPHHPNLESMSYMFYSCPNFNQDVNIPENVYNTYYMLYDCLQYNSNVYCYAKTTCCYSPSDYLQQINNFDSVCAGWSGNFNIHFINSTPTSMRYGFQGCYLLNQNIKIPSTVRDAYCMFSGCYNLNQNIALPNEICASGAFQYCGNLNTALRIPYNSDISAMFRNCNNYNVDTYVPVCRGLNEYDQNSNSYNLFYGCDNLNANVVFETGYLILAETFQSCNNFNYPIHIPHTVTNMYRTFAGCNNFNTQIVFGSGVTDMNATFSQCYNLNINMTLPSSAVNLTSTFWACQNLDQNIQIPSSAVNLAYCFTGCSNLNQAIDIPSSVEVVDYCFSGCENLSSSISFHTGLKSMNNTFQSCYNFNAPLSIPSSVEYMDGTFYYCTHFNQPITLPSSLKEANLAFFNVYNFKQDVTIPSSCYGINAMFRYTGVNNVNIQSAEINIVAYWGSGDSYFSIEPFSFRNVWYEYSGYTIVANHPCLDASGLSSGDTIATVTMNKDCIFYYNKWDSSQGAYVRHTFTKDNIFFNLDNKSLLYRFFGVEDGYIYTGSSYYYRAQNQAQNYADYQANYHDNSASLVVTPSTWYYDEDKTSIRFIYYDWANTSGGVTPQYNVFFNFV